MNTTNHKTSGLLSSLCLAFGFTRLANRLDPLGNHPGTAVTNVLSADGTEICVLPCTLPVANWR